ncbi:hypothetical protein ZIOFF_018640 [Zingiber officinale]|uniref:Uncharacterized protein n=1 Tax=Zingiber officinale TaxID=94328 RepID=A0A8J5LB42_ZINOF|nr:hypothetical protein ZIOFF_018640 [Zingiber officinale]
METPETIAAGAASWRATAISKVPVPLIVWVATTTSAGVARLLVGVKCFLTGLGKDLDSLITFGCTQAGRFDFTVVGVLKSSFVMQQRDGIRIVI